jgi:hypothetical protein
VRFHTASGFTRYDGWGGKEDYAAELVTLVALANFERDGEVGLIRKNVGLDRRSFPV